MCLALVVLMLVRASPAHGMEQQLVVWCVLPRSAQLLRGSVLEMRHSDSGIDHDGATVFLTDPSSSRAGKSNYGCLILTLHNFAIDTQINLPVVLSACDPVICVHAKLLRPT